MLEPGDTGNAGPGGVGPQSPPFNQCRLRTIPAIVSSSDLRLPGAPGNVLLPPKATSLPKDSTDVVSKGITLEQDYLPGRVGKIPPRLMAQVNAGLKLALDLWPCHFASNPLLSGVAGTGIPSSSPISSAYRMAGSQVTQPKGQGRLKTPSRHPPFRIWSS